ncbi:MAG: hypothetical protein GXP42_06235 [Chloroflexi bacterium]|nr:hypothetical protein [Chloroflexota bacterium]
MTHLTFLLVPSLRNHREASKRATEIVESLLREEGHIVRKVKRDKDITSDLFMSDVILLEVADAEDIAYCEYVRSQCMKPVFLYGMDMPLATWIKGLQAGGDAFIVLPEERSVLHAYLNALLRRVGFSTPDVSH